MKIRDLEFHLAQIDRTDKAPPIRSLLVCLTSDSGKQGWGEAPLAWRVGELPDRRRSLLAALTGLSVFDIEELLQLDAIDSRPLACALEMASWDLIGRIVGQPLCHLLGGSYRQHVPLAVRLPRQSAADSQQAARELAEHGFHTQVVAATGEVSRDASMVLAVVEAVSDEVAVRLDGRGAFSFDSARELCRLLGDEGVRFLIDPLGGKSLESMASLARQTNIPLAVSAGIEGPRDVMSAARAGAAASIVIDPARVGGLVVSRRCADVADAAGMSASLGFRPSLGVAAAAMAQMAAACPLLASGNECDYHQLHDDVLTEPLEVIDGLMTVPQSPGLGVDVDRAKLERYQAT